MHILIAMVSLAPSGCFPYRETYRPELTGHAVDEQGAPVVGALVEACSDSSWHELKGCPRRGTTKTDANGRFDFESVKELESCCLGEAPLPHTVVSVCMPDGRIGGVDIGPFDKTRSFTLTIVPRADLKIPQGSHTSADPAGTIRGRCAEVMNGGKPLTHDD